MHIRIVFIAPKAESRCSHLCRKKSGAPFSHVKLSFLIWHMASILILRRCFYLHALHGLREIKLYEGPRYAKVELRFLRVCCLTLLFLLFGEGSAVFTFREISCDSASWWNFISLLVKKKLNATSSRPPLSYYACVSRSPALSAIWVCGLCSLWFVNAHLFGTGAILVCEPCLLNLCEHLTGTKPNPPFLLKATEFLFSCTVLRRLTSTTEV